MDKEKEKKLLNALPTNEKHTVENFPSKDKVLEKLDAGYRISEIEYDEIEVKKGYSYYGISRGGRVYSK